MRALAVIVLAPAFALGAVAGAVGIVGGPTTLTQRPDSLVWAVRVFRSQQSFETWLRARGASYDTWAQRHPSAAVIFDPNDKRALAAAAPAAPHRTKGHSLLVGLVAGASLVLLFVLYALGSHRRWLPAPRTPRRAGKTVVLARPRLQALLATSAVAAVRWPSALAATVHDPLTPRRIRQLLPSIAFYAIAVVLAVVIGASVAVYLQ